MMSGDHNNNAGCANHETMKEELAKYDYIRFTWTDLNGMCRHKLIPARNAYKLIKSGVGIFAGILSCGPLTEEYLPPMIVEMNFPNAFLQPMEGTLHPLPWASSKYKMAQVLCEVFWKDGTPQEANPRTAARRQLKRLQEQGYSLMSAFEAEFIVIDAESRKPAFPTSDYCATLSFCPYEELFMQADEQLFEAGVDLECIHAEHCPGQFETVLRPSHGIQAADQAFVLKHALKEIMGTKGLQANYMAKLFPDHAGSGTHFNFSLWHTESKENVFYNESGQNKLSDIAQHWIAGLTTHAPALTAIFNPSVNCYRRLHEPWAPDYNDWGIDDRMASFRIKNYSPSATYFENRMPSGLSNPYLVLAATVAAGLDGVTRKLEMPEPGRQDVQRLPDTLAEALDALEQDTIITEAIGSQLVDWFIGCKREVDLKVLAKSNPKVEDDALHEEFDEYARLL